MVRVAVLLAAALAALAAAAPSPRPWRPVFSPRAAPKCENPVKRKTWYVPGADRTGEGGEVGE